MEILLTIILTLLAVGTLSLLGQMKDLSQKVDNLEFWDDEFRERLDDVEDDVEDIKNNKKGK